jgi:hypothetical protein
MKIRHGWLLCLFALGIAAVHAQAPATACPWFTVGTAAHVLGGEAVVDVHVSDAGEGYCNFTLKATPSASLRIEVSKKSAPLCGSDAIELRGVGTQASRCKAPGSSGVDVQRISGRVRDLHFALTQSIPVGREGGTPPDLHDDWLEQAAEIVAGNLF